MEKIYNCHISHVFQISLKGWSFSTNLHGQLKKKKKKATDSKKDQFLSRAIRNIQPFDCFPHFANCSLSNKIYLQPIWQQAGTKLSPFSTLSGLRFAVKGSAGLHLIKQDNLICVRAQPTRLLVPRPDFGGSLRRRKACRVSWSA